MYGLEKKPRAPFEFDLEKDLKKDPSKGKELLKKAEAKINELKGILRHGSGGEEYDNFGILLHGFAALQRVLNRIVNKK